MLLYSRTWLLNILNVIELVNLKSKTPFEINRKADLNGSISMTVMFRKFYYV